MPSLQTQLTDQNLSVLVIGDDSLIAQSVVQQYQDQSLQTEFLHINNPHLLNRLQELFERQQIYKTVLVVGFQKIEPEPWLKTLDFLKETQPPLLFLIRVSTRAQTGLQAAAEWMGRLDKEDQLLSRILQLKNKRKIILGRDVFVEGYLHYPFKFFFEADKNEAWLDPGICFTPQTEKDFLSIVAQELLRPNEKNYVVEGEKTKSKEFISKFIPIYQSFYKNEKQIVLVDAESMGLDLKPHNLVQVRTQTSWDQIFKVLCRDLPAYRLGFSAQNWFKFKREIGQQNSQVDDQLGPAEPESPAGQASRLKTQEEVLQDSDQIIKEKPNSAARVKPEQFLPKQFPESQTTKSPTHQVDEAAPTPPDSLRSKSKKAEAESKSETKTGGDAADKANQVDEKISRLFTQERTKQKTQRRSEKINFLSIVQKKSRHKKAVFWVGLALASVGITAGLSLGALVVNYNLTQKRTAANLEAFQQQEFEKIRLSKGLGMQAKLMGKIISLDIIEQSQGLADLNQNLASVGEKITQSKKLNQRIFSYLLSGGSDAAQDQAGLDKAESKNNTATTFGSENIEALIKSKTEIDQRLSQELSLIQAEIAGQQNGYSHLEPDLQKKLNQTEKQLSQIKSKTANANTTNPLLPEILGLSGKKVYYLVIQDDQELRPTGGFLQAMASITLENGQIIDQRFINVNRLDSKVMGKLNPPPEVESLLGESRLYLRDANWDPDFATTAQKITWYIREGTNQPMDGLIAVNYQHLKTILQKLGEITVLKYDESVNAANLYDRLQHHAAEEKEQQLEENFQIMLWQTALVELKRAPAEIQAAVLDSLLELLSDQQTPLYFSDAGLLQTVEQRGWSGGLIKPECPVNFNSSCKVDHIYSVEASIGINKVNPYVSRQQSHHIESGQTQVPHRRQIELSNKSHSQVWPLGNYKVYMRFYLNSDAQIESVLVDDVEAPVDEVLEYLDHNRKVVGIVLEVSPQSSKGLTLLYSTPHQVAEGDSYFFFDQAQPGIASRPVLISLSYPPSLRAELVAPQVEYEQTQVLANSSSGNAYLVIKFAK